MEKWFNKARSLCPLIWNCCLQIFWLTQLYKPAWWKLENDPSHPTAQHKYQVKSWTSWTLYGDLHTSMKMINCEKTEGAAMGSPFPLLLVTSTWRDLKNKQSHHHLTYTGVAYWWVNTIPFALGQDFKYNIRPTNSWLPLCYSAITWIIEKAARH